jgi:small subunit ribosomal protein S2
MSKKADFKNLLEAGVHFGHMKRKWNPAMAPYIFDEQKGIHVIDLNKTIAHLDNACAAVRQIAKSGKKILFVATKKQAKELVAERVKAVNMPYVTERWTGGMLTNFATTRKSIRKMASIDKMKTDGTWDTLNKREKLFKTRQREKLEKNFGSMAEMTRLPAAIFLVDIIKEEIAMKEAIRLNIPTFAMVDTNTNPEPIDFPIPANDDATKSIALILDHITGAIKEGLDERRLAKDKSVEDKKASAKEESTEETVEESEPKAEEVKSESTEKAAPKTKKKEESKAEPIAEKKEEEAKVEENTSEEEK